MFVCLEALEEKASVREPSRTRDEQGNTASNCMSGPNMMLLDRRHFRSPLSDFREASWRGKVAGNLVRWPVGKRRLSLDREEVLGQPPAFEQDALTIEAPRVSHAFRDPYARTECI